MLVPVERLGRVLRRVQGRGLLSRIRAEEKSLAPKITEAGQEHWRSSSVKITHHQDCGSPQSFHRKALEPKTRASRISDYTKIQLRVGFSDNS